MNDFSHSLHTSPLCSPQDLGKALPPESHAISLCLPRWEDVIGYKGNDKNILETLQNNYPRLFFHSSVQKLFAVCEDRFAQKGEKCVAFPSEAVAKRVQEFVQTKTEKESVGSLHEFGKNNIWVFCFPEEHIDLVRKYWQLSGEIISSRLAEHALKENPEKPAGKKAKKEIRERLARLTDEQLQSIALFPTGAAAFYTVHRFLQISFPDRKSVQFGFSYTDSLDIQEAFGEGVSVFPKGDAADFEKLEELLLKEKLLGIFCELPGNPLLETIDLQRLAMLSKKYTVPIIVDDTLGTLQNRAAFPFADIVISSLTKFFSGKGNVMGGALVLNPESRFSSMFTRVFRSNFEDLLWAEDAKVLAENSANFLERMQKVEENTKKLTELFKNHDSVYRVFVPELQLKEKKTLGVYGLFSFLLYNPEKNTPLFYDAVEVSKGPGFGMNFTSLCPYLQMHLFEKMEQVKKYGLSPYMLRISVGLEDGDELVARCKKALDSIRI